ncbi:hypothetical protein ES705_29095 [subsurface metagenome]
MQALKIAQGLVDLVEFLAGSGDMGSDAVRIGQETGKVKKAHCDADGTAGGVKNEALAHGAALPSE